MVSNFSSSLSSVGDNDMFLKTKDKISFQIKYDGLQLSVKTTAI